MVNKTVPVSLASLCCWRPCFLNKFNVVRTRQRQERARASWCAMICFLSCCLVPTVIASAAATPGDDERSENNFSRTRSEALFSGGVSERQAGRQKHLHNEYELSPQSNQPDLRAAVEDTQDLSATPSRRSDEARKAATTRSAVATGPQTTRAEQDHVHQKQKEEPRVGPRNNGPDFLSVETLPDGRISQLSSFFAQDEQEQVGSGTDDRNHYEEESAQQPQHVQNYYGRGGRHLRGRDADELGAPADNSTTSVYFAAKTTAPSRRSRPSEHAKNKMTWLQLMSGRAGRSRSAGRSSSSSPARPRVRRKHDEQDVATTTEEEEQLSSSRGARRPSETWVDFFANGLGAVALRQVTRGMISMASGGSSAKEFLSSKEIKAPLRLLTQSLNGAAGGESGGLTAALSTDTGNVNRFLGNDLGLLRPEGAAVFVQVIFRGQQTAGGSTPAPIEGPSPLFAELQGPLQTALQGQVGKVLKGDVRNQKSTTRRDLSLPVHFASPVAVKLPPGKTEIKHPNHLQQQQFQINLQYLFPLPQAGDLVTFLIPVFSSSTNSASPQLMFSPGSVFAVTQVAYHVVGTEEKAANHHGGQKQPQPTFASPEDLFSRGKKVARISLEAVPLENFLGLRGPQAYAPRIFLEDLAADTLRLLPPGATKLAAPGQQDESHTHVAKAPPAAGPQAKASASATTPSASATSSGSHLLDTARVGGFRVFAPAGLVRKKGEKKKRRGQLRVYRVFYDRASFARTLVPGRSSGAAVSTERLQGVLLEEDYAFYRLLHFAAKNLARLLRGFLQSSRLHIPKTLLREYDYKKARTSSLPAGLGKKKRQTSTARQSPSKDRGDAEREIRAKLGKRAKRYLEGLMKQILQATFAAFADEKVLETDFAPPLYHGLQVLDVFPRLTERDLLSTDSKLLAFPMQDSFLLMPEVRGFGLFTGTGGGKKSAPSTTGTYFGRARRAMSGVSDTLDMFGEMFGAPAEDNDAPDQAPARLLLPIVKRVVQGIDWQHFTSVDVLSGWLLGTLGRARDLGAETTQEKDGHDTKIPRTTRTIANRTPKGSLLQFFQGNRREQMQQTRTRREPYENHEKERADADVILNQAAPTKTTPRTATVLSGPASSFSEMVASSPEAQFAGVIVAMLLLVQGFLSVSGRKAKEQEDQSRNRNAAGGTAPTTTTLAELIHHAPIAGGVGDSFRRTGEFLFGRDEADKTGPSRSRKTKDGGVDRRLVQSFVDVLPVLQAEWGRVLASGKRYLNPAEEKKAQGVPTVPQFTARSPGHKRAGASFFEILAKQNLGRAKSSSSHIQMRQDHYFWQRQEYSSRPVTEQQGQRRRAADSEDASTLDSGDENGEARSNPKGSTIRPGRYQAATTAARWWTTPAARRGLVGAPVRATGTASAEDAKLLPTELPKQHSGALRPGSGGPPGPPETVVTPSTRKDRCAACTSCCSALFSSCWHTFLAPAPGLAWNFFSWVAAGTWNNLRRAPATAYAYPIRSFLMLMAFITIFTVILSIHYLTPLTGIQDLHLIVIAFGILLAGLGYQFIKLKQQPTDDHGRPLDPDGRPRRRRRSA
ncbi:unnamed protein product [Amoebophrya sp. A120]|nr:unnamed protein product [Amoebophrya sp. A120]|eukprot:GSA120T00024931001.1